jgi:dTDP-4-dehydrorhamnose reductase
MLELAQMTENSASTRSADPRPSSRILIFGRTGQLGRELVSSFQNSGHVVAVGRESVDLADPEQIRALVRLELPHVILNPAAYTAVDRAEAESDLALAINAQAPRVLAEEARRHHALLIHYSTDYVFDGKKPEPWVETDKPLPLNIYGASKLAGEQAIEEAGCDYLIFRTSWVYGPRGKNFLLTMLRLAAEREKLSIVDDQIGAPTTSAELARATHAIVEGLLAGRFGRVDENLGIYHMTCGGSTSWFGFAQAIFSRAKSVLGTKSPELIPIASKDYPTPATRPTNSVLSNTKLHARFGVRLADWQLALDEVLQTLRANSETAKNEGI